jgi:hypothetical protein
MTVQLVFRRTVSSGIIDELLHPSDGGIGFNTSDQTATIGRQDVIIQSAGRQTVVEIVGISLSELSDQTESAIINAVPDDHIVTKSL